MAAWGEGEVWVVKARVVAGFSSPRKESTSEEGMSRAWLRS